MERLMNKLMERVCVECGSDEVTFLASIKVNDYKDFEPIDEDYWCGECDGSVDIKPTIDKGV